MGNPRTATSKSGPASTRKSSPDSSGKNKGTSHSTTTTTSSSGSGSSSKGSSSDLWPEVAPEESSRRAASRKKSLSTSRDQLLYLQALFPYAPYDELMSIIETTDGPDEAAQHAYEALNPNYTGFLYLKEQTEVSHNSKFTKAQRSTAFNGLKEALEERAMDAFRPGMFSNLSQLQEYHETVGLFAVDTTDWDRAMLLPARELAEMAFMDLPLREEPSSSSSSSSSGEDHRSRSEHRHRRRNSSHHRRRRHSPGHHHLLSLALNGSNARFMNSSFVTPQLHSFDTAILSPHAPPRERRGQKPRDGCRTPIADGSGSGTYDHHHNHNNNEDTGVLYLQDSDPECCAPIIAWAPEAIRVGPAEARRQQEGALRVFDEATFFSDPLLLARDVSSIQLMTPDHPPRRRPTGMPVRPAGTAAAAASPESHEPTEVPPQEVEELPPPLLAVSPGASTHGSARAHREPLDKNGDHNSQSLPFLVEETEGTEVVFAEGGEDTASSHARHAQLSTREASGLAGEEDEYEEVEDVYAEDEGGEEESAPPIEVHCDAAEGLDSSQPPEQRAAVVTPPPHDLGGTHSDLSAHSAHFASQTSMRESTVETLKSRKRRPLTSSEKVKQRIRKLKPVGNLVFRENTEASPTIVPVDGGYASPRIVANMFDDVPDVSGRGKARVDSDVYTSRSAQTHHADSMCAGDKSKQQDEGTAPPVVGKGAHVYGSSAAAGAAAAPTTVSSSLGNSRDRVHGQAVFIPPAHSGCSSLDPGAYLNEEEERWNCIVEMLKPFEDVFGVKFRCELVRCVYDDCPKIRTRLTEILQRLLHVVGHALTGKEVTDGLAEEPMDLPLFGSILLSTSPVKLQELLFKEDKCTLEFCEEGTRLKLKLNVKKVKLDAIQFAYIDEADAARQNRTAQQLRQKTPQPRSRAAAWTLRHHVQEKYTTGVTRGTAQVSAKGIKLKGIVYVWLMASGKAYVTFQEAKVSVGSFKVSTDVPKLNALFTLGAPVLKMVLEKVMLDAVKGVHAL